MNKRTALLFLTAAMAATMVVGGCSKPAETPAAAPQSSATAAANVSDADVTNHVTMALLQNETLKGFNIEVVTTKGDVRLIGVLDNQAQIDDALKIARAAEGVHAVHDELTIKK